jgi:FkbM family methyltransferase
MKELITEETVRMAYRLLLGREAESEQVVRDHLALNSVSALRQTMMASAEFRASTLHNGFPASKWVATEVLGCYTMWVDLHDRFVSHGCLHNNWEPNETKYFASKLRPGAVVLDIGANIGWFSMVAAKHIGTAGRVHAFEPRPETARMLKRTVVDNHLQSVIQVHEQALSDSSGELNLVWAKGTDNPGGSFLLGSPDAKFSGHETARVKVGVLDEVLPDIAPDIVKIDVEGAEPKTLGGARNALSRKKPPILSELLPEQLQRVSGRSAAQYIQQMKSLGYACYLLEDGRPTRRLDDFPVNAPANVVSVVFESAAPVKSPVSK